MTSDFVERNIEELINEVKIYNPYDEDYILINKAYQFAKKAHGEQKRASGVPFIQHTLSTALILAEKKMDHETICAALLHDCVEDAGVNIETIKKEFGEEIADIVEGVTKTKKVKFATKRRIYCRKLAKSTACNFKRCESHDSKTCR